MILDKALFSNFVATDYKLGLYYLSFFTKLKLIMRKELANLVPTYKMTLHHVKIGFRILTTLFTKTALDKKKNPALCEGQRCSALFF